ncbi:NADH-quinone oxidoreductase subunit N [Occallatibacter savannae]|uniref:NADH-quinone oxidoreductase subunit N n=1 Tax=Occallatibacter savannae TaxID=1002691 RepID=UPI000D68D351|nr:NADH-quinone oxidoreductase subunit N [Occallatibacter savannae]
MNYADLFRVTLPETALDIAALLVLILDLGLLRKAALQTRIMASVLIGVLGCSAAMLVMPYQAAGGLTYPGSPDLLLSAGGYTSIAQIGILVLTVFTLFLLVGSDFTKHVGEFVAVVLMAATGGLLISAGQDLLVVFVGLELLSLGLYILTAFAKRSGKSAESAMKYYLFGGMSAAFLLFGFSYLYGLTGSTNLHQIMRALYSTTANGAAPLLYVALVMIAAGLGFKVAAVPFHLWAPDTYEGAPAPAAAFIASVSKVASFALLIGVGTAAAHSLDPSKPMHVWITASLNPKGLPTYFGFSGPWSLIIAILAVASMVFGNLAALAQDSVRRLLAYSAIAHAGYILLAVAYFSRSNISANAILYYILTYGLTTIGAFGAVSLVERINGSDRMDAFLGLYRRNGVLAGVLLILFLSLAGIPPLVGFWAKFNLFAAVLRVDRGVAPFALVAIAVAMSAVSLYYYLQVLKRVFVMPPAEDGPVKGSPLTIGVLALITLAVVLLGCLPGLMQSWMATFYAGM